MFDIGFMELCLIGVVALLVVGPERLPRLARTAGMWVGRARRFMSEVKSDISAEMREQDLGALQDIKQDLQQARTELEQTSSDLSQSLSDEAIMEEIKRPAAATSSEATTQETPGKTSGPVPARKRARTIKKKPSSTKKAKKAVKKAPAGTRKKVISKKSTGKRTGTSKKKAARNAGRRKK